MGVSIKRSNFEIDGTADITKLSADDYYLYAQQWDDVKGELPQVPRKYWKNDGGAYPVEMDAAEKQAVDDAEAAAAAAAAALQQDIDNADPMLKAVVKAIYRRAGWPLSEIKQNVIDEY